MSQDYTINCFESGHVGQTDLANMEKNFECLRSMFSGASAPSNPVAGMPWFDTTKKVQKQRNAGNSAWIGLMHGDVDQKIPVYRNSAMDGWAIDSSVTDKVIALKGGSVYTTGGATAGLWTISGLSSVAVANHTHPIPALYFDYGSALTNRSKASPGSTIDAMSSDYRMEVGQTYSAGGYIQYVDLKMRTVASTATGAGGHGHTIQQDGSWRVAAAVCTLQYLDL